MIIKAFDVLDMDIMNSIREVENICKHNDGLTGSVYLDTSLNYHQDMKSTFLLYEDSILAGFIFMFSPTSQNAEISACVLPKCRRRGYFKAMFEKASAELVKFGVGEVLFVCDRQSFAGKETVRACGAEYSHTEYLMKLTQPACLLEWNRPYTLEFCKPGIKDMNELVEMSAVIFGESPEDARGFVEGSYKTGNKRIQYGALLNGKYVGMAAASLEEDVFSIYGLGILPEYQGKGYGKELLYMVVKDLFEQGHENITLEVDSINGTAFNLYKNSGFEVVTAIDYYRKAL